MNMKITGLFLPGEVEGEDYSAKDPVVYLQCIGSADGSGEQDSMKTIYYRIN